MRKIVSARDQVEMLSPWLIEADFTSVTPPGAAVPSATSQPARPFGPGPGVTTWGPAGIHNVYNTGSGGPPGLGSPPATSHGGGGSGGSGGSHGGGGGGGASGSYSGGPLGDSDSVKSRIRDVVGPQFKQYNITNPDVQNRMIEQIYQQGITESGWRNVPQSPSTDDINMRSGNPAQGYLQYVPSTFNRAMDLAGTPGSDIGDPEAQIRGVIPLEMSQGKIDPNTGFTDTSGSGVGYGHGWG